MVQFSRSKKIVRAITKKFIPAVITLGFLLNCQVQDKGRPEQVVITKNSNYNRLHSHVLVRRVKLATEGYLDYAAFSKNIMLADPNWRAVHPKQKISLKSLTFGETVVEVKPFIDFTPLTESEKATPLAWTPMLEHLLRWNFEKASKLANAYSQITSERWGDSAETVQPYQEFGAVYIHRRGNLKEVWVEIEFKPWLNSAMDDILDQDRDGFPEAYVQLDPRIFTSEMIKEIEGDYSTKILTEAEVMNWAHALADRWHPSTKTQMLKLTPGEVWPYTESSQILKTELAGVWVANPLFILKGIPFHDTLYNAFEIDSMGKTKTLSEKKQAGIPIVAGLDKGLSDRLDAIISSIDQDLKNYGKGTWDAWKLTISPFQSAVKKFGDQVPLQILALVAENNNLVLRKDLDYVLTKGLELPSQKRPPIAEIAAFKDYLAMQGVEFIFVPIPTKLDIYPEIISRQLADSLPGHIPQPHYKKLLRDLAEARVETIDLQSAFLKSKASSENDKRKLYQKQDSHWSTVGLELAAELLANRVKNYSWFNDIFKNHIEYKTKDSTFDYMGDAYAQLPTELKSNFKLDKKTGHQVVDAAGNFYQDSDSSSVLVLGDSYSGVFHSIGCLHAGVTAHLAKNLGGPVDLITGWESPTDAACQLKDRGDNYLKKKKLVIWMVSVRDVFVYTGDWSIK